MIFRARVFILVFTFPFKHYIVLLVAPSLPLQGANITIGLILLPCAAQMFVPVPVSQYVVEVRLFGF